MALGRCRHIFRAVVNNLDGATGFPREQSGVTGDHRSILYFPAEAAARLYLHDANLIFREIEQLEQRLVNVIRALHRTPNGHAIFGRGNRNHSVVLNVKLLLRARLVFAFDDEIGASPDFVNVALLDMVRLEDVILAPDDLFLVDGIFEREDGGQRFDLKTNVTARFFEQVLVRMSEQHDRLFRVIDELRGEIRLIHQDERDAVFARNVFGRDDDEFVPRDVAFKRNVPDAATRGGAADGRAIEHLREM